jgi:hypothetical protein
MATAKEEQPNDVSKTGGTEAQGEDKEMEPVENERIVEGDNVELQEEEAWDILGYSFPTWRKW